MDNVKIILLNGKANSGKDYYYNNYLKKFSSSEHIVRFAFADAIKDIMKESDAKRVSKNAFDFVNKVITWISEEIALNTVILTHNTKKKLIEKEEIKFGTQKFLEKEIQNKKEED